MAAYTTDFTVTGSGEFPFDMLRYDVCYPADQQSVVAMTAEHAAHFARAVKLRIVHTERRPFITHDRWASFGWRVGEDIKTVKR